MSGPDTRPRCRALAITVLAACVATPSAAQEAPSIVEDTLAAWARRTRGITSIQGAYALTEIHAPRPQREAAALGGPFEEFYPAKEVTLQRSLRFLCQGDKIAYSTDGEVIQQGGEGGRQFAAAAFNGTLSQSLLKGKGMPMGRFELADGADRQLTANYNLMAIWLWLDPRQLMELTAWDIDEASAARERELVDGVRCVRLQVPRGGDHWTSNLYVDLSSERLPRKWEYFYKGRPRNTLAIKYESSDNNNVVSGWTSTRFFRDGSPERKTRAQVREFRLNKPVHDAAFQLKFPVGTHVVEKAENASRYYIQERDGLRQIPEEELGAIDEPESVVQ